MCLILKHYNVSVNSDTRIVSIVFKDIIAWSLATLFAFLIRFEGRIKDLEISIIFFTMIFFIISGMIGNLLFKLYDNRYLRSSVDEAIKLAIAAFSLGGPLTVLVIFLNISVIPKSIPLLICSLVVLLEFCIRAFETLRLRRKKTSLISGEPTLIYGAGILGRQVLEQFLNSNSQYLPIGFIDDAESKKNLRITGQKVLGNRANLHRIITEFGILHIIIAIEEIPVGTILELEKICNVHKVELLIVPTFKTFLGKKITVKELSEFSLEMFLDRKKFDLKKSDIEVFFNKKRILVTGAAGSIGSEIARQISKLPFTDVYFLDRDENLLLKLQLELEKNGLARSDRFILCDIRDSESIFKCVEDIKPDVIFHAAALKHFQFLELYPQEAFKTNVIGSKNLISAALLNEVQYFVNISTDKAADPISFLGKSKLLAERLISGVEDPGKKYISVRFGNVLGSNGSFLDTFNYCIENNLPISITDESVARYFMTISEAVNLVIYSVMLGSPGETIILRMGDKIKIADIANFLINRSGRDIKINYVGLRQNEKLVENFVGRNESILNDESDSILRIRVKPLKLENVNGGKFK